MQEIEEVIELWEKIEVCPAKDDAEGNTCCMMRVSDYAKMNQALAKLREAPEPIEFTKKLRKFVKMYENEVPKRAEITFLREACKIIDQLQAENDKLIEQAKLQAGS